MDRTCAGCGAPAVAARSCAYCDSPGAPASALIIPVQSRRQGSRTTELLTSMLERERDRHEEAFQRYQGQLVIAEQQRQSIVEGFQRHILPLLGLLLTIWTLGLLAATSAGVITFATDPEGARTPGFQTTRNAKDPTLGFVAQ